MAGWQRCWLHHLSSVSKRGSCSSHHGFTLCTDCYILFTNVFTLSVKHICKYNVFSLCHGCALYSTTYKRWPKSYVLQETNFSKWIGNQEREIENEAKSGITLTNEVWYRSSMGETAKRLLGVIFRNFQSYTYLDICTLLEVPKSWLQDILTKTPHLRLFSLM